MKTDYKSIAALAERLNAGADAQTFSVHALRHYARNAEANGLKPAIKRLGRKVLISESGFIDWIDNLKDGVNTKGYDQ